MPRRQRTGGKMGPYFSAEQVRILRLITTHAMFLAGPRAIGYRGAIAESILDAFSTGMQEPDLLSAFAAKRFRAVMAGEVIDLKTRRKAVRAE